MLCGIHPLFLFHKPHVVAGAICDFTRECRNVRVKLAKPEFKVIRQLIQQI